MFNISKSYVKLLGNALGYEYSNTNQLGQPHLVSGDYIEIQCVYEWLTKITVESGNPDLGLKAANNTHPAMLGTLGYAVMSCETLGEALERLVYYHSLISSASFLKIEFEEGILKLEGFEIGYKAPRVFIDSGASIFLALIKFLVPYNSINLLGAEFVYSKPERLDVLTDVFGCNIRFSSDSNCLIFAREIYDFPLVTASSKLNSLHTELLKAELHKAYSGLVSIKVKHTILQELSAGCISSLKSTSKLLNVSSRSLQYALRNEGETFTSIFEGARKELARHLIRDTAYNFKYICATLGFCEKSSFHKSILRWFGMTPQQYRDYIE
ncbi:MULTISPECIES: AraC family transcriptional regulator [Pseudomonas]|uniref:AraC family transcriptional regulator n=1 Tax=Pseudomonas TaxID=286 RepID=UPI002AB59A9A|nr:MULTISPECIES: AraC family transcriptional regulator ligand-binding domain-containing protein [unclassified Pseudomonas]MDY7580652.1 AraC family transcriptional regulator ligand-binding domain-containing protein [Pseudomonas sp. CCI3.1]MEB0066236.1 AraC family transcriptional regulator ligand-binding domain-containing protein [Pseudomonas sp. CCI3.1]MEB0071545.1 AraC family transcriptional regulator ligand-binding domain-containing protein [Pseudomonas sp. CCI1.4]